MAKKGMQGAWLAMILLLAACATVGRDFPAENVERIEIGQTTQAQIRDWFGEPWRTGWEDGMRTWTYGHYQYRALGENHSKDLLIRFGEEGRVKSYSFNTTR